MMQDVKFTERYRREVVRQHFEFYQVAARTRVRVRNEMKPFVKVTCSDLTFKVMLNKVFSNG